eukprot:CAMPEP_0181370572 /NCGR_PEP_ID=MMETSP1106-20121128/13506_1 /TAXON_ID=81844 /ORGANISM="Mantoniella antarctica, Strain SL-175" /LENGTH=80 /DNA_ID=CAMNT_0023487391 /DNA_START=266 /DNA_END=505 /DNA_ORIENTATION=-
MAAAVTVHSADLRYAGNLPATRPTPSTSSGTSGSACIAEVSTSQVFSSLMTLSASSERESSPQTVRSWCTPPLLSWPPSP